MANYMAVSTSRRRAPLTCGRGYSPNPQFQGIATSYLGMPMDIQAIRLPLRQENIGRLPMPSIGVSRWMRDALRVVCGSLLLAIAAHLSAPCLTLLRRSALSTSQCHWLPCFSDLTEEFVRLMTICSPLLLAHFSPGGLEHALGVVSWRCS
jgi:hypothetical protein